MKSQQFSFPLFASLVTFVAVVIMFALGLWQLERAQEKTERLLSIQQAEKTSQISLEQVLTNNLDSMLDMPITFEGQADRERYFLLDNKIHQGRVGYQVLVPIQTQSGTLLANYGWVAATNSRSVLPKIEIASDLKSYSGIVSIPTNNIMVKETALIDDKWPKLLQQTDLKIVQQHYQGALLPIVVLLTPDLSSGFVRNWQPVVMPPEKHMAYAIQWFLLALAAVVIFIVAQRRKMKRNNSEYN